MQLSPNKWDLMPQHVMAVLKTKSAERGGEFASQRFIKLNTYPTWNYPNDIAFLFWIEILE
jgi:hypothetical protein